MDWKFSVKNSKGPFSRVGVDMALEQTINAEAKSRLKDIIAFTDLNIARESTVSQKHNAHQNSQQGIEYFWSFS